jgi:hypothetical protein
MDRLAALLSSPAAAFALLGAVAWAPMTGFPTWGALSRGRYASTVGVSVAVAVFVFTFVLRLSAPATS